MKDPLGLVGTTIAEKYAVESVVGEGGFAIVYRAQHLLWKRPVAVKVFKALGDIAPDQRQKLLDDFIQEGRLLADLSERSAAICQARDVGMLTAGVPYMVLEWLEGRSLDDVLVDERKANRTPRSIDETVALLLPAAEALALAHKRGIAHRDVKPANIFVLNNDAGVKLLDFGIAKVVQDAQKMGFGKTSGMITSFTPLYGAPEQFNRAYGATGPWTDVFSLALLATEVVTGKEPLGGDNLVQLAFTATNPHVRPSPRTLGANVTDEVEQVFLKALAVQPEDRWQSAGQFWAALNAAAHGDRVSSARLSIEATGPRLPESQPAPGTTMVDPSRFAGSNAETHAPARSKSKLPLIFAAVALSLGAIGTAGVVVAMKQRNVTPAPSAAMSVAPIPSAAPTESAAPKPKCLPGMVSIPGSDFFMGSEEPNADDREKPLHKVKLAAYCIDELEVTVAKYKQCSDDGKCRRAGKTNVWPGIKPAQQKIYDPLCNINDPVAKAQHPINCVDWDQAREYCEAQGARLPTEAEWELAARGPDGRVYPWGDDPPSAKLLNACGRECVAWQKAHHDPDVVPAFMYDDDDQFANTAPVGSFPAGKSRYGVQDVVGNVWEWGLGLVRRLRPGPQEQDQRQPDRPRRGDHEGHPGRLLERVGALVGPSELPILRRQIGPSLWLRFPLRKNPPRNSETTKWGGA